MTKILSEQSETEHELLLDEKRLETELHTVENFLSCWFFCSFGSLSELGRNLFKKQRI